MLHCVAQNDDDNDPEAKETLRSTYADAGISLKLRFMRMPCTVGVLSVMSVSSSSSGASLGRLLNLFDRALA